MRIGDQVVALQHRTRVLQVEAVLLFSSLAVGERGQSDGHLDENVGKFNRHVGKLRVCDDEAVCIFDEDSRKIIRDSFKIAVSD